MTDEPGVIGSADLALRSGHWQQARDGFLARLAEHPDGRALEGLAQALWWLDDGTGCLDARERAYRFYREGGDDAAAGAAAASLAYDSLLFGEGEAVARGWWGLAHGLLDQLPERAEHGWLAVRQAELALATRSDPLMAWEAGERAHAIGQRTQDVDLSYVGLALSGLALTTSGDPEAGVPLLDSAVAAATTGEVTDLMWMGKILCWLILACQQTHDITRAGDWCRRVEAICRRLQLDPLFSVCRIQHSSVLIASGTWGDAEQNLTRVLEDSASSRRHTRVNAVVQLGELRRRQGRWAEAEALLRQAEFDPAAIAARALIRLEQGAAAEAWATMRDLLSTIPRSSRLVRARLLLPALRCAEAAGDRPAAEEAAAELQEVAALVHNSALAGLAAAGAATIATSTGGVRLWREAVRCFAEAELPFDEAESRLHLGEALLQDGDAGSAAEQVETARQGFEALGATASLDRASQLGHEIARAIGEPDRGTLTERELQVLRLVAQGLTNPQIAQTLSLSPHTVHRHVANVLTKLDQPTRAAAAAHAITRDLL